MIRILLSFVGLPVLLPLLSWMSPAIAPSEFHRYEDDPRVRVAGPIETEWLKKKIDELQIRVTLLNESLDRSFTAVSALSAKP